MKIALLGYGKMGQEIEKLAEKRHHEIILIIDSPDDWKTRGHELKEADIAIDFSTPGSIMDNIKHCFDANVPVLVGTTGWHEEFETVKKVCEERNQTLLYSPNFSIGVNLFFSLNNYFAKLMARWEEYEISIEETHHIHKLDAPSGTAIKLANDIIRIIERKEKWVKESAGHPEELGIKSFRTENVPGTHVVKYTSENDSIEITHTARNRRGLALGALLAAEWIKGKKGFLEMNDFLNSQILTINI